MMRTIYPRFPGARAKALTLSYDDAVEQDARLLALMTRYGVKGAFNQNSDMCAPEGAVYPEGAIHRLMPQSARTALYTDNSCAEVALHGATHATLDKIPAPMAAYEIVSDRARLEKIYGRVVRGMAYPNGTTDDEVVELLRAAGIAYARTTVSNHDFRLPENWLRLGATCHHNDPELMPLLTRFLAETPARDPHLFYLWGHAYEFDMHKNWNVIEDFLARASGHDDVWYATNIEIYDYLDAFAQLRFRIDASQVENPTSTDLWGLADGKMLFFPAGQTVRTNL